jgi:hypothetical protein
MSILDTIKRWAGLGPKPVQPAPKVIEQPLPNGRIALTDEKGNFLGFK